MLLSNDLKILAHPEPYFVDLYLKDADIPMYVLHEKLMAGIEISELRIKSYKGEDSVVFFREFHNGWYFGLVTPRRPYFESITRMALIISILGFIFATALIFVLINIDTAREKSAFESRQKSIFLANMSHEMRTPLNAVKQ